jgi:hypothetical protein
VDANVYTADWESVSFLEKPPKPTAPFLKAFWDIECYSASGDFPLARKTTDSLKKELDAVDDLKEHLKRKIRHNEITFKNPLNAQTIETYCKKIDQAEDFTTDDLSRILPPIAGDPIIQIGTVLERQGSPTERHVFVWPSCDPIAGSEVHVVKNEKDLIRDWCAWRAARIPVCGSWS